ncbi:hypothetical protein M5K25_014799 [Dendrobium thyrsiflorum]|uniref:non-specific serine/threonine protein kinase n=1 Tax=Dendrobium thyrsiflorum TaxID=117978 RepID=A0ABD0UVT0_DENTH
MTCCSFILKKRSSRQKDESDEEVLQNVKIYSYKVLRKATDNFSPANKLGEGGFGCVYKGRLKNGEIVAIKVLSSESRQGVREFLNELTVISNVVHENLVSLIGCCVDGNQRILVYNYLENNSLAKTLLGTDNSNIRFSWITRRKICIGVARGLKFLHEEVRPHIVHRDIKASNVLLDKDLTAKISDFGIAKLLPADMSHISTKVAGTIGRTVSVGRRSINFPKEIMAGRKVEVLEGELGQLKTDFEEKISDFQNQFSSIHEKMDGRFVALEDLMKKMIDDKQKPASSETIGGHGRGGNPNPSRGRENPEVEVLEGDDGMPPLEPLSREELSRGYDRQEAEYVGRREELYRRGAGFERVQRRGADFEGGRADFHRRCADFERIQRRGADFEGMREEIHRRGAEFEGIQRREIPVILCGWECKVNAKGGGEHEADNKRGSEEIVDDGDRGRQPNWGQRGSRCRVELWDCVMGEVVGITRGGRRSTMAKMGVGRRWSLGDERDRQCRLGYLAPEYAVRGQLTRKADIYSFGVLLVEIISGRNHTNTRLPYEDQILLERMWTLYKNGKLENIIDASLNGDFDAEEACRFLRVGLLCTQENPKLRPSMSTVIKMLEGEIDVDSFEITEPGLITDFMDLKVRQNNQNLTPNVFSAINSPPEASPKSSGDTTHASMSFTAIIDRA